MRTVKIALGGQETDMPAVTLGTVFFGTRVPRDEAFRILDAYYEAGGRWIDTARVYCTALIPEDQRLPAFCDSERVVGDWVRARGLDGQVLVITKGAHWNLADRAMRVRPECIRQDFAVSMDALGLPRADIYFLHNDDPCVPVSELMPALHEIVASGRALHIGASNWKVSRIREANGYAQAHGLTPFSISQVKWSYAAPTVDAPAGSVDMEGDAAQYQGYREMGMPVMAYSSQARGFFLKASRGGFSPEALGSAAPFLSGENLRRAEAVLALSRREGIPVSAAAQAYLWSRDVPVTALIGPGGVPPLQDSLRGCDYLPTPEAKALLEAARCAASA